MLILATTSDRIELVTGQAVTVDVHASFVDWDGTAATPGNKNTLISTATTTQIVAPPAAGVFRTVKTLIVRNRHASSSVDVTVNHVATAGAIVSELLKVTLVAGRTLLWAEGVGFLLPEAGAFLPLAGGTMTGLLTLSGAPTAALQAATKQYADLMLPLVGGVSMTGLFNLSGDPTAALHPATKQYIDARAASKKRSAVLVVSGNPAVGAIQSVRLIIPTAGTITAIKSTARVAATGNTYTYDVNKNGTTIYTTQTNRPTRLIADGTGSKTHTAPDVTLIAAGDVFDVDVDGIGTGISEFTLFIEFDEAV